MIDGLMNNKPTSKKISDPKKRPSVLAKLRYLQSQKAKQKGKPEQENELQREKK